MGGLGAMTFLSYINKPHKHAYAALCVCLCAFKVFFLRISSTKLHKTLFSFLSLVLSAAMYLFNIACVFVRTQHM